MMSALARFGSIERSRWHGRPPRPPEEVATLARRVGRDLAREYVELLSVSDGGELVGGDRDIDLWSARDVAPLNADYDVGARLPTFLGIGTDGGGILLGYEFGSGRGRSPPSRSARCRRKMSNSSARTWCARSSRTHVHAGTETRRLPTYRGSAGLDAARARGVIVRRGVVRGRRAGAGIGVRGGFVLKEVST